MNSILTNAASISALQTLRMIGGGMRQVQDQVSSGLRISAAADNAAYWSISTTMRSDHLAISAVSDALGLGAAKVDTAYSGLDAVVDVLSEFKAKLVAAREPGVDRGKIQKELEQLKSQVVGISRSASFGGENWLRTDLADLTDETDPKTRKSIVASFVRDSDANVSINTLDLRVAQTSLFNTTGGGLLQKDPGQTVTLPVSGTLDIGGLVSGAPSSHAHKGHTFFVFTTGSALSPTDTITFDVTVDSSTYSGGQSYPNLTIDQALVNLVLGKTDGSIASAAEFAAVIDAALAASSVPAGSGAGGYATNFGVVSMDTVDIGSDEALAAHPGSSVIVSNLVSTLPGNFAFGLNPGAMSQHMNLYADASMSFTQGFQVDATGSVALDVTFAGAAAQSFTITKADIDAALGSTDGIVKTAADMAAVMNQALATSGLAFSGGSSGLRVTVDPAVHPEQGGKSDFVISNVTSTGVTAVAAQISLPLDVDFDFLDIDVSNGGNVDHYIAGLETMLGKVVAGAATLGALQKRVEIQSEFTLDLMDTITTGVGRLVDADMNEASTRLKALQAQEQLAIQALQIANAGGEQIMQLFRS